MSSFLSTNNQPADAGWKCGVVQPVDFEKIVYLFRNYVGKIAT